MQGPFWKCQEFNGSLVETFISLSGLPRPLSCAEKCSHSSPESHCRKCGRRKCHAIYMARPRATKPVQFPIVGRAQLSPKRVKIACSTYRACRRRPQHNIRGEYRYCRPAERLAVRNRLPKKPCVPPSEKVKNRLYPSNLRTRTSQESAQYVLGGRRPILRVDVGNPKPFWPEEGAVQAQHYDETKRLL